MMKSLFSYLVLAFSCSGALYSQDSLPEFSSTLMDWNTIDAATTKFSKKDVVRLVIGTQGLGKLFSEERNDNYVSDFHFTDLNQDKFLDIIYSGIPASTQKPVTMVFIAKADRSYPKKFEGKGLLCRMQPGGNWLRLLTMEDSSSSQSLVFFRKYTADLDSSLGGITAEACIVKGTIMPSYFEPTAEHLVEPAELRLQPAFGDSAIKDIDGDGKADMKGNVVATFLPGTEVVKLSAKTTGESTWDFVMIRIREKQSPPILSQTTPGFTFVAGWIEDKNLK